MVLQCPVCGDCYDCGNCYSKFIALFSTLDELQDDDDVLLVSSQEDAPNHESTHSPGDGSDTPDSPTLLTQLPKAPEVPTRVAKRPRYIWTNEDRRFIFMLVKEHGHQWKKIAEIYNDNKQLNTDVTGDMCRKCFNNFSCMAGNSMPQPVSASHVA